MFEASLQKLLVADGTLALYLSTFEGAPAIFSELAPEGAIKQFITYRISRIIATDYVATEAFSVFVDYYDKGSSRANSRKAAQRIEFILDQKYILDDARYNTIRLSYESAGPVSGSPITTTVDAREIHYNLQFSARAGRQAWANQI
jgi:hypothetical protein